MMFDAIDGEIKRILATVAEVNVSPREIEKAKHDAYFVNQYAMGKNLVFTKCLWNEKLSFKQTVLFERTLEITT